MTRTGKGFAPFFAIFAVVLAGCGGSPSTSNSASTAVDTTSVVVGFGGPPDVGDLPQLVAIKKMQAKGYNISTRVFQGDPLLVTAANQGDAQILNLAAVSLINADLNGNNLVLFLDNTANETELVAASRFKSAKDLDGATMALASPTSSTHTLAVWTEKQYNIHFKYIYQGSSQVRSQALLAHRVDSSILEIDDVTRILQNDPSGFSALINYYKQLPWLLASVWTTTSDFAKKHHAIVQEFTNELIAAFADAYKNENKYIQQGPSLLPTYTADVIKASMDKSVSNKVWGDNGRITKSDAQKSLDFWAETGIVTDSQKSKLANLSWFDGSFVQSAKQP